MSVNSHDPANLLKQSEPLLSAEQVSQALDELADRLQVHLSSKPEWLLLPVLQGGMWTAMQLAQRLPSPLQMDYIHASRYRGETSGGELKWLARPQSELKGRSVLLVDDIFDEGHTLEQIKAWLEGEGAEVLTVALVCKQHQRGLPRDWLDLAALEVPDDYVFGCGMDLHEYWRQLPEIRVYTPDRQTLNRE